MMILLCAHGLLIRFTKIIFFYLDVPLAFVEYYQC